ncbi:NUDIX hydrolase [Salinarimonas soli]|uniref:NUDIX hydrolase n=1 Tax=Salinarimonas soli TaxID=1638099 RepID=A0A5B2VFB4_9HYPH|nr:NUDIX hydrolase [Salinarimonas soli]KAA2237062.1 NUDIX hydrolase [Salinarimonas soli]
MAASPKGKKKPDDPKNPAPKKSAPKKPKAWRKPRVQYAALPFRREGDGRLCVFLVTSRETRRWVIPKGWPIRGLKPHDSAAREAYEEAGLEGRVRKKRIGGYTYEKRLDQGLVTCAVDVFPLEVKRQTKRYPEKGQRDGRWMEPAEAADLVQEPDLADLIRRAPELLAPKARKKADAAPAADGEAAGSPPPPCGEG